MEEEVISSRAVGEKQQQHQDACFTFRRNQRKEEVLTQLVSLILELTLRRRRTGSVRPTSSSSYFSLLRPSLSALFWLLHTSSPSLQCPQFLHSPHLKKQNKKHPTQVGNIISLYFHRFQRINIYKHGCEATASYTSHFTLFTNINL